MVHVCGFIWERTQAKSKSPSIPPGGISGRGQRVTHSKVWGSCQTAAPIGTKCCTHVQIHLGMDIRQINCPSRHQGHWGGGLGAQTFKSVEKLSNGWTDWHQLWFTSADSSGNGHRLNPSRPSIPQGAFRGGGRGHKFKSIGKLSNGCTDWHQIWYTSADSSGNGHRLNTIRPTIPQGHLGGGGVGDHTFKCLGKLSNGWTDWHQIWYKSADSSGNRHRLNTIRPSIPQGVLGGQKFKSLGKLSNCLPDWHQIWYTPADSSGNGHRQNTIRPSIPHVVWGGGC